MLKIQINKKSETGTLTLLHCECATINYLLLNISAPPFFNGKEVEQDALVCSACNKELVSSSFMDAIRKTFCIELQNTHFINEGQLLEQLFKSFEVPIVEFNFKPEPKIEAPSNTIFEPASKVSRTVKSQGNNFVANAKNMLNNFKNTPTYKKLALVPSVFISSLKKSIYQSKNKEE